MTSDGCHFDTLGHLISVVCQLDANPAPTVVGCDAPSGCHWQLLIRQISDIKRSVFQNKQNKGLTKQSGLFAASANSH